jgi:3-dehydroquinate synthase
MGQDKKVRHGKLTFILARGIGQAFSARDVSPGAIGTFLADEIALPP